MRFLIKVDAEWKVTITCQDKKVVWQRTRAMRRIPVEVRVSCKVRGVW